MTVGFKSSKVRKNNNHSTPVNTRPTILYTRMKSCPDPSESSSDHNFHHQSSSSSSSNNYNNNNHNKLHQLTYMRESINRIPVRYIITALVVLATCIDYITRVNINVAIVTMVKQNLTHSDHMIESCPLIRISFNTTATDSKSFSHHVMRPEDEDKRYDWSPKTQGVILGSFWYSYMLMQIPSGRLAEEFGGKWIVTISLIGSGLINMITPYVAYSVSLLTFSRILLGLLQGGIFPSCFAMLHKWMPVKERSIGFAFMDVGATIGSVVATTGSGYLSEHGFSGGWPSVFYMSGLVSLLALFLWVPYVESNPDDHKSISRDELNYINESKGREKQSKIRPKVPWKSLLTSGPVIAVVVSKFSLGWTYLMLLSKLPAYLHDVLHIPPTENGLLNASLYLTSCISLLGSSHLSEKIIHGRYLSRTSCRKTFQAIACFGSAIPMLIVPSVGCDTSLIMGLLLFGNFCGGFNAGGDVPVAGELTHNFPATVYAMANMVGCSCGFIAPYVVGVILESGSKDEKSDLLNLWAIVFYVSAAIATLGGITFLIFGSAVKQNWDQIADDEVSLDSFEKLEDTIIYDNSRNNSYVTSVNPSVGLSTSTSSSSNSRPYNSFS